MGLKDLLADLDAASRAGVGIASETFRNRRLERHEPLEFSREWNSIDSVQGWLSRHEAELLFHLASLVPRDQSIVEIGSYCGRSTTALALGADRRGGSIYAVDPHTGDRSEIEAGMTVDTFDNFCSNMRRLDLEEVVITIRDVSHRAAQNYSGPPIALLFVDGWHSAEAVIDDVTSWMPHVSNNVLVVFDDFGYPDVAAGIATIEHLLPNCLGSAGKDLVYGPDWVLTELPRLHALLRKRHTRRLERFRFHRDKGAAQSPCSM
jgi:MMP 1-O-methyltransferase